MKLILRDAPTIVGQSRKGRYTKLYPIIEKEDAIEETKGREKKAKQSKKYNIYPGGSPKSRCAKMG